MAFVAPLDELLCIFLQSRPKLTYSDNFANQGSQACRVSTYSFMDLLQNIFGFLLINALQVRYGEASFVQGVIQDREPCYPFSDLPGVFDILWKSSILKEGQDWGHPAAFALDCEV